MYKTIWGAAESCDRVMSDLAKEGWRLHSFQFCGLNDIEIPPQYPNAHAEVVRVPCFAYILALQVQEQPAEVETRVPRQFLGMKT